MSETTETCNPRIDDHEVRITSLEAWRVLHEDDSKRMTLLLEKILGVMIEMRDELKSLHEVR